MSRRSIPVFVAVVVLAAATVSSAEEGTTAAAVSSVLYEGRVAFQVDHPQAVAIQAKVFEDETGEVLFDSGPQRGRSVTWPMGAAAGPFRFVVKAWNADGALVVSQSAASRGADTISEIPFEQIPGGTSFRGGGSAVGILAPLNVGRAVEPQALRVFTTVGTSAPNIQMNDRAGQGAEIQLFEEDGTTRHTWLVPDAAGSGGFFEVEGGTSGNFYVDGNGLNGSPTVKVGGSGSTTLFVSGETSSDSVQLPPGAIEASEIIDEPGVAANHADGTEYILLSGDVDILLSRTMVAPRAGYVVAWGAATVRLYQGNQDSWALFGVSSDCDSSPTFTALKFNWKNDQNLPAGLYEDTQAVHAVFPVPAGIHTFCLLGDRVTSTSFLVYESQLTLAFFPTAYGATAPSAREPGLAERAEAGPSTTRERGSWTPAEVEAERAEAITLELARIEREHEETAARIEALLEELTPE